MRMGMDHPRTAAPSIYVGLLGPKHSGLPAVASRTMPVEVVPLRTAVLRGTAFVVDKEEIIFVEL